MERTLHPAPRWRDVVLEQIRIVALRNRPIALVLGVVFGIVSLLMLIDIIRGNAKTWFDSGDWMPIALFSVLFPLAVWRNDRPFGPAFLWTLPVERWRLAFAKVLAGWVWLFTALAVLMSWQRVLAALARVENPETLPLFVLSAATALYLLGSAVLVGLRHPLRWLFGAFALSFLAGGLSNLLEDIAGVDSLLGSRRLFHAVENAYFAFQTLPDLAQWAIASAVCVGPGLVVLWAALSRHRERRRH